jgi:hypothetical protein
MLCRPNDQVSVDPVTARPLFTGVIFLPLSDIIPVFLEMRIKNSAPQKIRSAKKGMVPVRLQTFGDNY